MCVTGLGTGAADGGCLACSSEALGGRVYGGFGVAPKKTDVVIGLVDIGDRVELVAEPESDVQSQQ